MLRLVASLARLTLAVVRSVALESAAMSSTDSIPSFAGRIQVATTRIAEKLAASRYVPEGAEVVYASELTALRTAVETLEAVAGPTIPAPAPGPGEVVDGGTAVPAPVEPAQ